MFLPKKTLHALTHSARIRNSYEHMIIWIRIRNCYEHDGRSGLGRVGLTFRKTRKSTALCIRNCYKPITSLIHQVKAVPYS